MGRRRSPLSKTMVTNHHPLVREAMEIVAAGTMADDEVTDRAGVGGRVLIHWRKGSMPRVANLDAVLQVMGYRLKIVRIDDV